MNVSDVKKRIKQIKEISNADYESAHSLEDDLFFDVLTCLAEEGNELAKAAIKSRKIEFNRYCS